MYWSKFFFQSLQTCACTLSESGLITSITIFPRSCVCSSIRSPYWTWLPQEPFCMASLLPQENTTTYFQNNGYLLIMSLWGKRFGNHVVLSIFIIVFFFFFWNQWHWSLEILQYPNCHSSYAEFRRKGNPEPERIWCKTFLHYFLNISRFSSVRCMVTWAIFGMSNDFCRQKQNKRNQSQDCAVWGDGHFTLEFYSQ